MGREYTERLSGLPGLQLPVEKEWARQVYWMYGLVLDESTGIDVVEFARRLKQQGVETRPFFLGMHEQPVFHERGLFVDESYPVAKQIANQGLYLPSGLSLTLEQIGLVSLAVRNCLI
jgi:perosamine synthetase